MTTMNQTQRVFTKSLWLHKDPEMPENFNEIFRSRTEPYLDNREMAAVLSHEAHLDGDMIMHVCLNAKPLLPKELWSWVGWGEKVKLEITVKAHKKKLSDAITEPITKAIEEDRAEGQEYLKTHDRLLFALKGDSVIHERQFVLHTPFADDPSKKNVEFVNSYGEIIHHAESEVPTDYYEILGHVGDVVTPYNVGRVWGNDISPKSNLKECLTKAYQHGLRFEDAAERDEIVFVLDVVKEGIISLTCDDEFYGFGDSMRFSTAKDYKENKRKGTLSLDKHLIESVAAYRWFFNKPDLHVVITTKSNGGTEDKLRDSLCTLINKKVNEKYAKYSKKRSCFDADFLRTKTLVIPYAEESC